MKNMIVVRGSLMALLVAQVSFGDALGRGNIKVNHGPGLSAQERLEKAVRDDQAAIAYAGNGGKLVETVARREMARRKLTQDQAALEAFKKSPAQVELARLQQAVRDDEAAVKYASIGDKLVYVQMRLKAAREKLARDKMALESIQLAISAERDRG